MTEAELAGMSLILLGLISIAFSYFNWDWFMNNHRMKVIVHLIGRGGTRLFYALIGLVLGGIGVIQLLA